MIAIWRRYEGPTWVVALLIYGVWLTLAAVAGHIPPWIAVPLAVYVTAWHSSLQHETIHALRRVPRWLRTALAFPPLGVVFSVRIVSPNVYVWLRHVAATACLLWLLYARTGLDPLVYLALVAYPAASVGLIRSFAEHRTSENAGDRTATIVSRGALSLLFLNNNFHSTHHEKPTLPWYEIPGYWRTHAPRSQVVYVRGYRQIARSWLWRVFDAPVRTRRPRRLLASDGDAQGANAARA